MTDRPTPNPPAWVHTRLSNLEATVGDMVVQAAEWRQQRAWLSRQADSLADVLVRLAALEAAVTPVCAPVAAATGADGLREPGEAETALSGYRCAGRHYEPTVTRTDNDRHVLNWPANAADTCAMARDVLIGMVAERNALTSWKEQALSSLNDWHALERLIPDDFTAGRLGDPWPSVIGAYIAHLADEAMF